MRVVSLLGSIHSKFHFKLYIIYKENANKFRDSNIQYSTLLP